MKQTIMKEDILKVVSKYYQDKFPENLKRVSEHIEAAFVLHMKEVNSSNHSYDLVSKWKLSNNEMVNPARGYLSPVS